MYFWVVLATFLAILASYNLAPRADMREITVERLAQADLGKFTVQHSAAYEYVRLHKPPYTGDNILNNYVPGVISDAIIEDHLPFGHVLSGEYTSQIFCMDAALENELVEGENGPCNESGSRRMLVTYGPIPERWVNLNTEPEQPSTDMLNAMRNTARAGEVVGYTGFAVDIPEDEAGASEVQVLGKQETEATFVPEAVLRNTFYNQVCNLGENKICLISMRSI